MNIGTIVDPEHVKVRLKGRGGMPLGEVEEGFAATLRPGDTFLIGGQTVRFENLREMVLEVVKQPSRQPRIAAYAGVKMATSTQLSARVLRLIGTPSEWGGLPAHTRDWLALQREISVLPQPGTLTCETFPRGDRHYLTVYGFAGRNAHQTLGLLLTHRMEQLGLGPLGFVANDYALMIWSLDPVADARPLLAADGLREGLVDWLGDNAVMKRTFRNIAIIAGLIQRNLPGQRKSGRQATFSTDIIYDTLRKYDPDHLMLRITAEQARSGLVDFGRIEDMLARGTRIVQARAPHVTPLSAPLLLEMGRVPIRGQGSERLAAAEAERLMNEAGLTGAGLA